MRQSTQRSIGARKLSSSSVQDLILPKSGVSSVGVAIPPLHVFSGNPPSVNITSRDDADSEVCHFNFGQIFSYLV